MDIKIAYKDRMKAFDIDDLKAVQGDLKTLSEESYRQLRKEIEETGFAFAPHVWIDQNGKAYILDGHQRYDTLKRMRSDGIQIPKIPVVPVEAKSLRQAKRRVLQGTSQYGEMTDKGLKDFLIDSKIDVKDVELSFRFPEIDLPNFVNEHFRDTAKDETEDEVPEALPKPKVKNGELYQLGEHRLLCGDSTNIKDVERLMNGEKADLCFTSPPYSDQRDYSGKLELDPKHLSKFLKAPCDIFVVNLGLQRKEGEIFQYWQTYIDSAKENDLDFLSWNIWDKMESGSIGNLTAMFPIEHEWIFVFGNKKSLNRTVQSVSAGKLKIKKFAVREKSGVIIYRNNGTVTPETKKLGTVLSMSPYKARNENLNHPAVFPVDFPAVHIEAITQRESIVYEPFGGSGSTLIACEKTNRKCYMMEIDPSYCGVILDRWAKYTDKYPVRSDGKKWSEIRRS